MLYRYDADLVFLGKMQSEDLNDLVYCLTHDKEGDTRLTEELTVTSEYKSHNPDHHQYWELIAAEIQGFGANTFATIFRGGRGVEYKEVLMDVCDKMKVSYNKYSSTEEIEGDLLVKILLEAIKGMSSLELKELADVADVAGVENASDFTLEAMTGVFQAVFRVGGFKSYQLTVIIVNAVLKVLIGRGLSLAGNAALTKAMGILTGPAGWVVTGLWTAIDIAGTAYRVTIPAVIQVIVLRQKYMYGNQV